MRRRMRVAYADPPYLGKGKRHYGRHHAQAARWDQVEAHGKLIHRLADQFPDGWALSLSSTSLQAILPLCPPWVRVGAWVKPFAVWKKGVNPTYGWEPVIFAGGRRRDLSERVVRDWLSCSIAMKTGLVGAKPAAFAFWVFDLLGLQPGDVLVDLFPGTGAIGRAFKDYCAGRRS